MYRRQKAEESPFERARPRARSRDPTTWPPARSSPPQHKKQNSAKLTLADGHSLQLSVERLSGRQSLFGEGDGGLRAAAPAPGALAAAFGEVLDLPALGNERSAA